MFGNEDDAIRAARTRRLDASFSCRGSWGGETPRVMVQAGEPAAWERWVAMAHELQEKAGLLKKSESQQSGQSGPRHTHDVIPCF